jgi:serine/threonine protein kinase
VAQERSAIDEGVPEEPDAASPPEETGPAALSPGTRIAGYEIGRRLGVGAMGAVYEGVRVDDGKPVAIKLLAADLADKPTARARFLNEGTLTARVPHPHVVAVFDSGEEAERVYLVMDLLAGEDLARRLRRTGPMSVGEAIDVIGPICDALAAAHRAGVTHRDLKPSNVFLAVREGRLHPMLLDFGVATDDDATGDGDAPQAATWNGIGTPMYLAPELVGDRRAAGPSSDQYALGAIVYEMLTGEPPYAADNLQQLLRTIAAGNPPSARARRPEVPPKLDALVLRAMSPDPHGRFPSVEDLGRALQAFAVSPETQEQEGRRRPPSSPAIAQEAEVPSPFVRTLVPEQEAKSGPWFVAPDADEIPEDECDQHENDDERPDERLASAAPGADAVAGGSEGGQTAAEAAGARDESPRVEDTAAGVEDDRPTDEARSPEESPPSAGARRFPAIDWQAVSGFATKHRRIVVSSGIALLGIVVLLALRGGRTASGPAAIPAVASPVTVERPAPAAPPTPPTPEKMEPPPAPPSTAAATVEKTEPTPAPPVAPAAVEKTEPAPTPPATAAADGEKSQVASTRPPAPALSTRTEPARERPKAEARRERPAPARAEAPLLKVAAPAPPPRPRAPENAPVRMHNGVPLLD